MTNPYTMSNRLAVASGELERAMEKFQTALAIEMLGIGEKDWRFSGVLVHYKYSAEDKLEWSFYGGDYDAKVSGGRIAPIILEWLRRKGYEEENAAISVKLIGCSESEESAADA